MLPKRKLGAQGLDLGLVADVAFVDATHFAELFRERDHLVGGGVAAGCVVEA